MKTIEQHNQERKLAHPTYPMASGIACPKCGKEMHYRGPEVLACYPPRKEVICLECGHNDYVLA